MPTVLYKPIKPARFKRQAMIAPLVAEANAVANDIELDFELTVDTWNKKPKFDKDVSVGPKSIDILVGTDNLIYKFVSRGTRKNYPIVPKRPGGWLRFQAGYNAKTTPGLISSKQGGKFGDVVYSQGVIHPGIEARKFEETIAKKWKPRYKQRMQKAMSLAGKASGHGVK